jgi:hypothetical protein
MSFQVINPYQIFYDSTGQPRAGGWVTFFVNTTSTVGSIYSDEALTVAQTNPYELDAFGRITGDVKYSGLMTLQVTNADGSDIITTDDVTTTDTSLETTNFAIAGGTVDAITASFTPAITSYTDGLEVNVRASGANTLTTPTLNIDGVGAKTITKIGNIPLVVGEISRAGHELILRRNDSNDVFELLNPNVLDRYPEISGEPTVIDYSIEWWDARRYVDDSGADVYTELQAYFDAVETEAVEQITVIGDFNVSQGIVIKGSSATLKIVNCDFSLQATAAIDTLLETDACRETYFKGRIWLNGTGTTVFTSRTCRQGLLLTDSGRAKFDKVLPKYFYQYGVNVDSISGGNNNLAYFDHVRPNYCGTWTNSGDTAAIFTWSNPVDSGSSGSTSQTTVLDLGEDIPNGVIQYGHIEIDSELYLIQAFDDVSSPKTLTIYPWLNSGSGSSGSGAYVIGAGVNTEGSDSNIVNFNSIDATNCGVGFLSLALFGSVVNRLVNQGNFIGYSIAARTSSAHVTDVIGDIYSENNLYDVVKNAVSTDQGTNILGTQNLTLSKCIGLTARNTGNALSTAWMGFESITLNRKGTNHEYIQRPLNEVGSVQWIDFTQGHKEQFFIGTTVATTYVLNVDEDLNRLFGYSGVSWTIVEDAGGTLGAITINEPGGGWTVMGGATYVYTPGAGVKAVRIVAVADFALSDFRVAVFDADN